MPNIVHFILLGAGVFFFTALNILALCFSEQLSYLDSSIRSGVDLWHVRQVRGSHQGLFTPGVIIARCRDKTFLRTFPDAPRITRFPVCAVGADSIHSHVWVPGAAAARPSDGAFPALGRFRWGMCWSILCWMLGGDSAHFWALPLYSSVFPGILA